MRSLHSNIQRYDISNMRSWMWTRTKVTTQEQPTQTQNENQEEKKLRLEEREQRVRTNWCGENTPHNETDEKKRKQIEARKF